MWLNQDRSTGTVIAFEGEHEFMSNFYPSPVRPVPLRGFADPEGMTVPTVEHAFQAAKTEDPGWRTRILYAITPGEAKMLGRRAPLKPTWEADKYAVMRGLLADKFADEGLKALLLATGDAVLLEGNTWNDDIWGVVPRPSWKATRVWDGHNWLGRLLMERRGLAGGDHGPAALREFPLDFRFALMVEG